MANDNTVGSYLQGINSLRNIQWAQSYYWDIQFMGGADSSKNPAPPSPFTDFFPAIDYTETPMVSNTLVIPYYISQYKILQTKSNIDIQLNFHDDVNNTLYTWMRNWFDYVLDDSDGVCTLEDAYRQLNVLKLNSKREPIQGYIYYVIPEGSISENLNSMSDLKTYSASFAVVGKLPVNNFNNDPVTTPLTSGGIGSA